MVQGLQGIIGTDKHNPHISIFLDSKTEEILVYHGFYLMEVLANKKDNPQLKILAGRLYNAKVKSNVINREFGYCYRSIKRWAEALKNGSNEDIYYSLKHQGAPKKLTKEIEGFVSYEFKRIYPKNKKSYSKEIRQSILEVFDKEISTETLRPLFKKLKGSYTQQISEEIKKNKFRIFSPSVSATGT